MKNKFLILFVLGLLTGFRLDAQSRFTFLPSTIVNLKDTVADGTTVQDSVRLFNNGPDSINFIGSIGFITAVHNPGTPIAVMDTVTPVPVNSPIHSNIQFLLYRTYQTPQVNPAGHCKSGNNVVVIWPISANPNFVSTDTLRLNIYVITKDTGFHHLNIQDLLTLYPNPASTTLTVKQYGTLSLDLKSVVFWDDRGRMAARYGSAPIIDVSKLARGAYVVEIQFAGGQRIMRKVWKE